MSPVALWELCLSGKLVKVRAALASGEDVNRKDIDNRTGLMWAVIRNHNSVVRLLLEQPTLDLNLTDLDGWTALHLVAIKGNVEGARLLLADPRLNTHNHKDNNGWTPLMTAIFHKNVDTVRELVAHQSVDLDARNILGLSLEDCAR